MTTINKFIKTFSIPIENEVKTHLPSLHKGLAGIIADYAVGDTELDKLISILKLNNVDLEADLNSFFVMKDSRSGVYKKRLTPLHLAIELQFKNIVAGLINSGADINKAE